MTNEELQAVIFKAKELKGVDGDIAYKRGLLDGYKKADKDFENTDEYNKNIYQIRTNLRSIAYILKLLGHNEDCKTSVYKNDIDLFLSNSIFDVENQLQVIDDNVTFTINELEKLLQR